MQKLSYSSLSVQMRSFFFFSASVLIGSTCSAGCAWAAHQKAIPQTRGFQPDSHFQFTVSPNDRWIVYFERLTPEQIGTRDNRYGNLRVLDLDSGEIREFIIPEGQGPAALDHGDASWTPDGSYCVLPPPIALPRDMQRGVVIDLHDTAKIRVIPTRVHYGKAPRVEALSEQIETTNQYTCSDCSLNLNNVNLIKEYVDPQYTDFEASPFYANVYAKQIVSPDGKAIYYQRGAQTDEVTLVALDIASGVERELASYRGECAQISRMRPSPDGKKLAFQFTTGCGFVSKPIVYVIDVATGVYQNVATASGGTMHWTSDSRRLFFYRDDYLHVAEFGDPPNAAPTASTAPATTAPATQPD